MPDLVRSAAAFGVFPAMLAALRDVGLSGPLRGPGPWTLLIVPDDAFRPPADEPLEAFLRRHVLPRAYDAWELAQVRAVWTWGDERLVVEVAGGRPRIGGVPVIQADVRAENGLIHVLGRPLAKSKARAEELGPRP